MKLLVLAAAAALAAAGSAHAEAGERTVSVTGAASVSLPPDVLSISLGVETQAPTALSALAENSERMAAVFAALRQAGLPDGDSATGHLSIYPVYDYGERQELVGYRVSNQIDISTAMLGSAAALVDGAVEAGANRVDSVSFGLSAERAAEARAGLVESAVLDARARADMALEPLGYRVVGVKSVDLGDVPWAGPAFAMADSLRSAPISAPDSEMSVSARVVFLMARA